MLLVVMNSELRPEIPVCANDVRADTQRADAEGVSSNFGTKGTSPLRVRQTRTFIQWRMTQE